MLMTEKTPEADSKLENLKELILSMKNYSSLQDFLENISLQTSIDQDWDGEKINLMTMHAAKGLEFDVVFYLVGKRDCFLIKNQLMKKVTRQLRRKGDLLMLQLLEQKRNYLSLL